MSAVDTVEQSPSQEPSWIARNQARITALAVTAVAAFGVHNALRGSASKGYYAPAPVEASFTNPIPIVMNYNQTQEDFQQSMYYDYAADDNYAAGVVAPTSQTKWNFLGYYANDKGLPITDPPRLREVVVMEDKKAFSGEETDEPHIWPLTVYNATKDPVDVEFMRYSAIAIRAWQAQYKHKPIELYDGSVQAKIEPVLTPHVMIMNPTMPPQLHDIPTVDGTTEKWPGVAISWIQPRVSNKEIDPASYAAIAFENPVEFETRSSIATEMCQSLTNVHDAKPLIGGDYDASIMQESISTFNKPAAHDLKLTAQESVCNALGEVIASMYIDGTRGVGSLVAHPDPLGLTQVDPFSYAPFIDDLDLFSRISEGVKQNPSVIETYKGPSTLTAHHYLEAADQP